MQQIWLGLDVGTTAIKAAAYLADGTLVALRQHPTTVERPRAGAAEQDMEQVWQTAVRCLRELVDACAEACDGAQQFRALGVCAQGDGLWPIDAQGRPTHKALLWSDTRAGAQLDAISQSGGLDAVGAGCHTALWTGTAAPLWRWLCDNEPEAARRTAHALTCADWIAYKLSGVIATDMANGSIPFMDFDKRHYGEAVAATGCADLGARLSHPRPAVTPLEGGLSPEAAQATGLPQGLTLSTGTLDLGAMIVGMGMDQPGQTMMIMGTTAVVNILTETIIPRTPPLAASVLHPSAPLAIRVLAPSTGAGTFDWFTSLHPTSLASDSPALAAEKMNALVAPIPPGADGVIFLPYLNGERAPFVDAEIRACFHGLSATTSKAQMARAVMEGAALSLRHCCIEEGGLPSAAVQLTGGGSRNPLWCQIIADVIGQTVLTTPDSDQGLWGAACIGASASGLGTPTALARSRQTTPQTYTPDPDRARLYDAVYARYAILSRGLRAIQQELRQLTENDR